MKKRPANAGRASFRASATAWFATGARRTPWPVWVGLLVVAWRFHVGVADGGDYVATLYREWRDLGALGEMARGAARGFSETTEVGVIDLAPKPAEEPILEVPKVKRKDEETAKDPVKKDEPKKPEEKNVVVKVEDAPKPPALPMRKDNRVAVQQHVKPNQDDNPNANHIAEEANKVAEETRATVTAHDQDNPDPTLGGNHPTSATGAGDSDKTKIADSDDHEGKKDRAPGERGKEASILAPMNAKPASVAAEPDTKSAQAKAGGDHTPAGAKPTDTPPATTPTTPDVVSGGGTWSFNPIQPKGAAGSSQGPGLTDPKNPFAGRSGPQVMGLGASSGSGRMAISLTHADVVAVFGEDQLRSERVADGERRRSEHRGKWVAADFRKWKPAIENYVGSVKPGNTTALNAARSPFAKYLHEMHIRIHPIFADSFLGSIEGLPPTNPLSNMSMITRLEIVLTPTDGRVVKLGIIKTSGVTSFDVAALDSVDRAGPYGKAPSAIVSADGNVYLHWEFHRDERIACSNQNASPYMLTTPAKPPTEEPPSPKRPNPQERSNENPGEVRHGALTPNGSVPAPKSSLSSSPVEFAMLGQNRL